MSSNWKPSGPPKWKRAAPLRAKASCNPPDEFGIEIATEACGMSTLMRPVGERVKATAPRTVKTPPALMVTAVVGSISPASLKPALNSSNLAAEANFTRTPAVSPTSSISPSPSSSRPLLATGTTASGSVGTTMVLSSATPELFMRTVIEPLMVSPSSPTRLASP